LASAAPNVGTRRARLLIGGQWVGGEPTTPVVDKFSGALIGEMDRASREDVARAVTAAGRSFESVTLEPYDRYRILLRVADLIEARREDFIRLIVAEAGFPVADAANEVTRAVQTFIISAEEGKRLTGEVVPIQSAPGQAHRLAFSIRVPRGVVCGITSFNSPLNMVAHKVAPAIGSGNTVVLKPSQATPLSAAMLFELLLEAELPPGHANLVLGPGEEIGRWLVENPDIRFFSFTGSTEVGKQLQRTAGLRPIALELGSVAGSIVCDDADLQRAATRVAHSAFRRAGQACTSTQKLFVDTRVHDRFVPLFIDATRQLAVGDPHDPSTAIGPMISEKDAVRAESWVQEAIADGARLLEGGRRQGPLLYPTILTDITPRMRVGCEEVFAPVVSIVPFTSIDAAIDELNAMPFGLATGIFTRDVMRAMNAARRLHVGIVHINEPSSSRVDLMPFGGVKDSGLGREGPKYAMQEMTEERLITLSLA
jgi:succinate-semialdehyde dehydrogenase / glutarate-semialdehyde dehydrogenase